MILCLLLKYMLHFPIPFWFGKLTLKNKNTIVNKLESMLESLQVSLNFTHSLKYKAFGKFLYRRLLRCRKLNIGSTLCTFKHVVGMIIFVFFAVHLLLFVFKYRISWIWIKTDLDLDLDMTFINWINTSFTYICIVLFIAYMCTFPAAHFLGNVTTMWVCQWSPT